jgi:tRNA dimethylallyltransferase
MKPLFLVITGPTAVGKTDFVAMVAKQSKMPIEIINGDMGQFYQPLSIGTAKPCWQEADYPHHLFDILTEPQDFTVHDYRAKVVEVMHQVWQRGALPIIVGGSGFYLKSIFFPPKGEKAATQDYSQNSELLWQELCERDPNRAKTIDPHDRYRIIRALSLWQQTGKNPSLFVPAYEPPAEFLLISLYRDRQDLHQRINHRVVEMIENGWLQEIRKLSTPWKSFLKRKKLIGYPTLIDYSDTSQTDLEDPLAIVQAKTRQYAKRQMTFWTSFKKQLLDADSRSEIEEVNLTFLDLALYINQLSEKLFTMCDRYV